MSAPLIITTPLELYLTLSTYFDKSVWSKLTFYHANGSLNSKRYIFSEASNFLPGERLRTGSKPKILVQIAEESTMNEFYNKYIIKRMTYLHTANKTVFWDELMQQDDVFAHCRRCKLRALVAE